MKEKWEKYLQKFWNEIEKWFPFLLAAPPLYALFCCFRSDGILLKDVAIAMLGSLGVLLFLQGSMEIEISRMDALMQAMAKCVIVQGNTGFFPVLKERLREMDGKPIFVISEEYEPEWCVISVEAEAALIAGVDRNLLEQYRFSDYGKTWVGYENDCWQEAVKEESHEQ